MFSVSKFMFICFKFHSATIHEIFRIKVQNQIIVKIFRSLFSLSYKMHTNQKHIKRLPNKIKRKKKQKRQNNRDVYIVIRVSNIGSVCISDNITWRK